MHVNHYRILMLLFCLMLAGASTVFAANGLPLFERLNADDGLSHNTVTSVIQDSRGFLWIGTMDGLCRYDGTGFSVFRHDPADSCSLSRNFIMSLCEDSAGKIWIGTYEGGANIYDPATGTFSCISTASDSGLRLCDDNVGDICQSPDGTVWLALRNGFTKYDPSSRTVAVFSHIEDDPASLLDNIVLDLLVDRDGTLWIGTRGGLDRFDPRTETFEHFVHDPSDPNSLSNNNVHGLFIDKNGTLWAGTEGGLNRFNRKLRTFTRYRHDPDISDSISDDIVMTMFEDDEGLFWVGTSYGLNLMDRRGGTFSHFRNVPLDRTSIAGNWVKTVVQDRSGVLWFGTGGGLSKLDKRKARFNHRKNDPTNPDSIPNNYIVGFSEDSSGAIWIATDAGGVSRYDPVNESYTHYRHNPKAETSLASDWCVSILVDSRDRVWAGTGFGLCLLDRKTGKWKCFAHDPDNPNSISDNWIISLAETADGAIWAGTGGGLNQFDEERESFIRYIHEPDKQSSLSSRIVRFLLEDAEGTLWIGTDKGLNSFNPVSGDFRLVHYEKHGEDCFCSKKILALHDTPTGIIWVGTDTGLYLFDRNSGAIETVTILDGLPNNTVNSIVADRQGMLWIGTNSGLAVLDANGAIVKTYTSSDGLQSNQFNPKAVLLSSGGELFFGGNNGFNRFRPEDIRDNPVVPPVQITSITVFDRELPMTIMQAVDDNPSFGHNDNFISFSFAALDFSSPEKNRYRYRLQGLDRNWVDSGNRNFASYTGLKPGNYSFRVQGSNSDGVWNEEGANIRFRINPPFWGTLWFRISAMLLAAGILYGAYRMRIVNIQMQKLHLEQEVISRTEELRDMTKELTAERQRLFSVLDAMPVLVFLQARDYSIKYSDMMVNHAFPSLCQVPCYEAFRGFDVPCSDCSTRRVFETSAPEVHEWFPVNGRSYQLYVYPFNDIDGTPLVLKIAIDITDRKQAERDRITAEKMQVVLEMAGAAAHEINQPLQILSGHLELLMQEVSTDEPCKTRIEKLSHQVNRLKKTTEKLNNITRYKTKDYVAGKKIIDIEASSDYTA